MKKLLISLSALAFALSANAAWNTSSTSGYWNDVSIWNQGHTPSVDDDGINIGNNTTVYINTAVDPIKTMFIKPNGSLVFKQGASLTSTGGIAMDGVGSNIKFLGGSYVTATNINHNNHGDFYFGGYDDVTGDFVAAVAKSVNSTARLQWVADTTATFNLAASNLIDGKVSGRDDNAIFYTTGELQVIKNEILLDFTNITVESLAQSGIADSGTYYVALASWGITYKAIGGADFNPTLSADSHDTDLVSFKGFEWGNGTSQSNNTLYAVLNVSIPEPATYAALFGALALAFAAYRRRK